MTRAKVLPLDAWPARDLALWQAGLRETDDLEDPKFAARLSPTTIHNARKGYGRFLAVLEGNGALDLCAHPDDRVTPQALRVFMSALEQEGNNNNTRAQRAWELRTAVRIMCPADDFSWLTCPGGVSIRAQLPSPQKPLEIIDFRELLQWGLDLIAEGMASPLTIRLASQVRNGLIIAILATRAPRQRTLASPQIGRQFIRGDDASRLAFTPEDIKTHRQLEYDLPKALTPSLSYYLDRARPLLLRGESHDWLWVGEQGKRFSQVGISAMVRRAWLKQYGKARGTHIFRHCLATTVSLADMNYPAAAAAIIGASPRVVELCYDRAQTAEAARLIDADFLQERQQCLGAK